MEKEVATFILGVIDNAMVPANDQVQQNLSAVKQWLRAIAAGKLIVKTAEDEQKTKDALAAASKLVAAAKIETPAS